MTKDSDTKPNRRAFLKLAGSAAPAAVAATALAPARAEADEVNLDSQTMQDTAHTRAYLASTRF